MESEAASEGVDATVLRPAVEFVLSVVREGHRTKPPLDTPSALRRLARSTKVTPQVCEAVRRAIEADPEFRARIAADLDPEAVDEIAFLWLRRPEGWQAGFRRAVVSAVEEAAEEDARRRLKGEERRRVAAEEHRARVVADAVGLRDALGMATTRAEAAEASVERLRAELAAAQEESAASRREARHARDREAAAMRKLEAAMTERASAADAVVEARDARDDALADRARTAADRAELVSIAARAGELADRLAALAGAADQSAAAPVREPVAIPGGLVGDGVGTAEFLFRLGADVLVDGYNVAKTAWPDRDLAGQRAAVLDECENLARRFGRSPFTVVFDGAAVVGAVASGRRMIRTVYSPEGVEADDVIRDEVAFVPVTRAVVVVTDDAAIVRDVRAVGANHVPVEAFLGVIR